MEEERLIQEFTPFQRRKKKKHIEIKNKAFKKIKENGYE